MRSFVGYTVSLQHGMELQLLVTRPDKSQATVYLSKASLPLVRRFFSWVAKLSLGENVSRLVRLERLMREFYPGCKLKDGVGNYVVLESPHKRDCSFDMYQTDEELLKSITGFLDRPMTAMDEKVMNSTWKAE